MIEPYIGLRPYQEADRDKFFGREAEKRILIDKVLTRKLTLLFAASGVGKSSLLQAAVIPKLKEPHGENLDVVYHNRWFDRPLPDLKNTLITYLQQQHKLSADDNIEIQLPLKEFFHQSTLFTSEPLIIVLDQFEEFFYYQHYKTEIFPIFISQLAEAILDRATNTAFVISMREDFALELNAFKAHLSPAFLFENLYRLEKLTQASAREAMVKPLAAVGFSYEAGLLDTLITDLSQREQIERLGFSVAAKMESPDFVEPPNLQIVCQQLWELEQYQPRKLITIATYISKGKANGLLENYFLNQINQLSPHEKHLASSAFDHLVSKYGTKIALPLPDLAKLLEENEATLGATLDKLEQARILRRQLRYASIQATEDSSTTQSEPTNRISWYELYHDLFSKTIYNWNEDYKRRQYLETLLILKASISDTIEVYNVKPNSWDLGNQQSYCYETDFQHANLEIDKLFQEKKLLKKQTPIKN
ncbi:MAG: hypothetical protein HC877_15625 [Thioploca sp.]|nr:hypothetical protein [Thioploca sp.]